MRVPAFHLLIPTHILGIFNFMMKILSFDLKNGTIISARRLDVPIMK